MKSNIGGLCSNQKLLCIGDKLLNTTLQIILMREIIGVSLCHTDPDSVLPPAVLASFCSSLL